MEKSEVRAVIKYFQKKGLTVTEVQADLTQVLGESAPPFSTTKRWFADFKRGRETCERATGSGAQKTAITPENIDKVHDKVMEDRRVTVRKLAEDSGLSIGTIHTILAEELGLSKLSARWVPRMLTPDQKRIRVTTSEALLTRFRENPDLFRARFVTMDEVWVHHFDPETKEQSKEWREKGSRPPKSSGHSRPQER